MILGYIRYLSLVRAVLAQILAVLKNGHVSKETCNNGWNLLTFHSHMGNHEFSGTFSSNVSATG